MEPGQGLHDEQGGRQRFLDREPLWGLFTGRDVQEGNHGHAHDRGNRLANPRGPDVEGVHERLRGGR